MPLPYAKPPLSQQLPKHLRSGKLRTDIISPRLCDDAIQRLAPSLAPYVGCTIIDENPGVGLWSSKLHEFLKPRRHVLLERDKRYLPFLQPLLNAPGSRYKHLDWGYETIRHPDAYVKEGVIPTVQEAKAEGSLMLIVANYAGQKASKLERDIGSRAHLKAIDFAHAARQSEAFNVYGPTRVLMWASDTDRKYMIPKATIDRNKIAAYLEASFHVEQIVGGGNKGNQKSREDAIELESRRRVAERMANEGIVLPPDRRFVLEDVLCNSSTISRSWHRELEELEEGFKSQKLSQFEGQPPGPLISFAAGRRPKQYSETTPEYKRWRKLDNVLKGENKQIEKVNQYLRRQDEIDQLDLEAHRDGIDPNTQAELLTELDAKIKVYKDAISILREKERFRLNCMDDERRAFAMDPPLLMWDRRTAEPLLTQPDEFWPSYNEGLSLVDFQTIDPQPFPMTDEQSFCFDIVTANLLGISASSDIKSLGKWAPGAFEALVPQVPAFTDPRKGGRRDAESIRNRTLTPEMLYGLAIAWDKWLFKPLFSSPGMTQSGAEPMQLRRGARQSV
ncbi:hypothetical protein N7G274_007817 [Stereocaulon virgatum]|uniref:rRNA adenine N(6)-methyltransferase n=1 Tax=Stereocaulon virgatum TaxID=373712 RepID=A0ABR4A102_9LECA